MVLKGRQRATPSIVVGAVWIAGVVEVNHDLAVMGLFDIKVTSCAVSLLPAGPIDELQKELASVIASDSVSLAGAPFKSNEIVPHR